ncbi:aspartate kinase [Cyclobacterium qasimii]|uniref:Aspartokinase n=2 Tax=Cyclobacterium qasimii TaxID=1350429 RepID=S7WQU6_9BACT|nr:aspartate kinase [Cyclobacterium qasimii]EPR66498.1 Aspartokinase [Cyclobacterium qasimii M12-11B]GEO21067.1 aspartokinase [Cyclobacterium qasimii]
MTQPLVYKFGGASIKDAKAIQRIAQLLKNHWANNLVIVVSAAGKTTDKLEHLISLSFDNKDFDVPLFELLDYHLDLCKGLFEEGHPIFTRVENHFAQLRRSLENSAIKENQAFFYDQIIGYGELISTRIFQEYLCLKGCPCLWQDARELVSTDSRAKMARVDWALTMQHCRKILIPMLDTFPVVTQGFIGRDLQGNTTTLGREGSDFTAAIMGVSLGASSVTIWKDVAGILNGDPDIFPDAVKFEYLDFEEAAEMTYYGASVIHPKTIKPLSKHGISLHVKSFLNPSLAGTIIGAFGQAPRIPITIIKHKLSLIELRIRDLSMFGGFHFDYIYDVAEKLNADIQLIQGAAAHINIVIDALPIDEEQINKAFRDVFRVSIKNNLRLVTVKNPTSVEIDHYRKMEMELVLEQKSPDLIQWLFEKE